MTARAITITDGHAISQGVRQGALAVRSRSGLHPTEIALLEQSAAWPRSRHALVVGNRTGVLPMAWAGDWPESHIVVHAFDLHHARAIVRNLARNGFGCDEASESEPACWTRRHVQVEVRCAPALPDGTFDVATLQHTEGDMPAELVLDLLEQVHGRLADGAACVVATDAAPDWLQTQLKKIFGAVSVRRADRAHLLSARKTGALRRHRDFAADFEMTLPAAAAIRLVTLPGVFCHRRPDQGGLALAEVAVGLARPGDHLLDLGCGCGMVGLAIARNVALARTVLVDAHARAVWCALENARRNEIAGCSAVLSDTGLEDATGFDLCVANPPYFSDFRIADMFIRTAHGLLHAGGRVCFVAKNTSHLEEALGACFEHVDIVPRRGYRVVVASAPKA